MDLRAIAFSACRLLAAYLAVTYGLGALLQLFALFILHISGGPDDAASFMAQLVILLGYSAAVCALWFGADRLSGWLVRPFPHSAEGLTDTRPLQAVVLFAVGWLAILHAARPAYEFADGILNQPDEVRLGLFIPMQVLALVLLGLGAVLVAFSRQIAGGLQRLRQRAAGEAS
ncbi:MAG: hypothetical protein JF571_06095 [Asticcacaulis sp.]|nr:hypothetical protein [Asticcacaulis sp.]